MMHSVIISRKYVAAADYEKQMVLLLSIKRRVRKRTVTITQSLDSLKETVKNLRLMDQLIRAA